MSVVSLQFAVFTLAVLVVTCMVAPPRRVQCLLAASCAFYATWAAWFVLVAALLTAANFAVAERLRASAVHRRRWLWLGIVLNVGTVLALRQGGWMGALGVVGLSFYGLQCIAYLVDTYTGALRIRPSLSELAAYVLYFPKLLAGPIERPGPFISLLRTAKPGTAEAIEEGVALIALGAVRKLVLADPLSGLVPVGVFSSPATCASSDILYGLVAYMLFLYNDFAGYSDIARGTSALFGIRLSVNFAQPFFAADFSEFWGRWHASLSRWLRDYVYLPISRAILRRRWPLRSWPNLLVPPMAAMILSGLWHGARSNMMLWGVLQGSFLVAGRLRPPRNPPTTERSVAVARVLGRIRVFVLVGVALAASRAGAGNFLEFWVSLARNGGWAPPSTALFALVGLSFALDFAQVRSRREMAFLAWPQPLRAAVLAVALATCALAVIGDAPRAFVYQGF